MFFKKKELAKQIAIYISEKHKQLIIAPMHKNNAGILFEQEQCFVTDYPTNSTNLGSEVISNLNSFSIKDVNLRDHKSTDWSAFKHSKAKSVRAFKQDYIYISVRSVNDSNLILEMKGVPFENSELTINSRISFQADKEKIGQRIVRVYESCLNGTIERVQT